MFDNGSLKAFIETVTSMFAPGQTTIEFSPVSSTVINAVPVGLWPSHTPPVSTPASRRFR
jgi:hypothetical protein